MATYTVVKGDCLYTIARDELGDASRWTEIASLNSISSPYTIHVGDTLTLPDSSSSSSSSSGVATVGATISTTSSYKIKIIFFGLQAGTGTDGSNGTVSAFWSYDHKDTTDHYELLWRYGTGDGNLYTGTREEKTLEDMDAAHQSSYSAPDHATFVKFKCKPYAETETVNGKEVAKWTGVISDEVTYDFSDNPPAIPDVPEVEIEDYTLTASLSNLDINADSIEFQIVKDNASVYNTGTATITMEYASYSCTVASGSKYKVRCRSIRDSLYSDYGDYSDNYETKPSAPTGITTIRANSETSVYLEWGAVDNATTYDIEFTTNKDYFDGSDATETVSGIEFTRFEKTGLESGDEYFFRVRAVNDLGESAWSDIVSVIVGDTPAAPTTWSSTTTAIVGEELNLYWVHNAKDGSKQTYADLELIADGLESSYTIDTTEEAEDEDEEEPTHVYAIDTTKYDEGTTLEWRVRTAGITKEFGDWSIQRTVDIYAPPTLEFRVTDINGDVVDTLTSFPFYAYGLAGPTTQAPIGYFLVVTSGETYETVDSLGNTVYVNAGDAVYSKYFDTAEALLVEFSAGNINLENNVKYTVTCSVSMNSGLTTESSTYFTVSWSDEWYWPNAAVGYDSTRYTTYIRPYCNNINDVPISGIVLSVYRREYDGTFTELATNIPNTLDTSRLINLIPVPFTGLTSTDSNITITDNGDGTITIDGTVEDVTGVRIYLGKAVLDGDTTYFLSGCPDGGSKSTYCLVNTTSMVYDTGSGVGFTANFSGEFEFEIQLGSGTVCDNLIFKPQLEIGTSASAFEAFDGVYASNTFVTDPHPSLDYARYRIVATVESTGAVSFYDMPGYPINEKAVIIQWEENWTNFDTTEEDEIATPPWTGSLLRLPYNIDVSDSRDVDVSFVEYIGRKRPVSYYGTQLGETATWKVDIDKTDKETLYTIRRLSIWTGDVYVREPSGSGYWASVDVSFSQTHCELTIPITFKITRVEGGV